MEQVREDYLINRLIELEDSGLFKAEVTKDNIEEYLDVTEEEIIKEALADLEKIKYNPNNYADEKFVNEYFEEKKWLDEQYKNLKVMASEIPIRALEISKAYKADKAYRQAQLDYLNKMEKKK